MNALDIAAIRHLLPGREIKYHSTLDSTMHEAARLATASAPSGTAVIAEQQSAGIGRYHRPWHSEAGSGLYLSLVLRIPINPLITMALGLATMDAIQKTTGITCDLRWPNDVLIEDRKVAGILTHVEGNAVIAGIGVNVNHTAFPPELAAQATSLRIASGHRQSREALLVELLPAVDDFCSTLMNEGKQAILEMFSHASSYVRGRRVSVDQESGLLTGTTAGLTPDGFLLVRGDDHREHVILAGGVRPCS
jgi:BirA family transcriptional regulator, biotin operon repressor / biotin---[acetyl-CoA-carboxylase] ligase